MTRILSPENIQSLAIGKGRYFEQKHSKAQIYLHHTSSHPHPLSAVRRWQQTPYRMGTAILIAGKPLPGEQGYQDGDVFSAFPSSGWAFHLSTHDPRNQVKPAYASKEFGRKLERHSIGISLCNAGALSWENGRFYSAFRSVVSEEEVVEYSEKFRGQRFFQKYTPAQIESLQSVLLYLCRQYFIPKTYRDDMWDLSENALSGMTGIFTHASVHTAVSDCHPQPELIRMLQGLSRAVPEQPAPPVKKVPLPEPLREEEEGGE